VGGEGRGGRSEAATLKILRFERNDFYFEMFDTSLTHIQKI